MSDWIKTSDGWKQTSGNGVSASEVTEIKESLTQLEVNEFDVEYLGWSVPKDCLIQNSMDANGVFHQKVGRVDLGQLDWFYNNSGTNATEYYASIPNKAYGTTNMYSKDLEVVSSFVDKINTVRGYSTSNEIAVSVSKSVISGDGKSKEFAEYLKGKVLYYALDTPVTRTDGNEAYAVIDGEITDVKQSLNTLMQRGTRTLLLSGASGNTSGNTVALTDSISNYDMLIWEMALGNDSSRILEESSIMPRIMFDESGGCRLQTIGFVNGSAIMLRNTITKISNNQLKITSFDSNVAGAHYVYLYGIKF